MVVIGGGDTGTDCVGTSLRHGCRSLVQLEILPQPPAERAPDNPWPQWPKVYRVDYGQEEAAARFGADPRHFCVATKRFVGDASGRVKAIETVGIEWVTENGRMTTREVPGSAKTWPADLVLLALGFVGPERAGLLEELGVALDARGNVAADEQQDDERAGRLRRGRHAARTVARRLGDRRGPPRGRRGRRLPALGPERARLSRVRRAREERPAQEKSLATPASRSSQAIQGNAASTRPSAASR